MDDDRGFSDLIDLWLSLSILLLLLLVSLDNLICFGLEGDSDSNGWFFLFFAWASASFLSFFAFLRAAFSSFSLSLAAAFSFSNYNLGLVTGIIPELSIEP